MAIRHKRYPHYGVQFHPESIGTYGGVQILSNFCDFAMINKNLNTEIIASKERSIVKVENVDESSEEQTLQKKRIFDLPVPPKACVIESLENIEVLPEDLFDYLYRIQNNTKNDVFWLDSTKVSIIL